VRPADVLATIVIIMRATLSYLNGVSYYIDAGLAVALLSFSATIVTAGYIMRRRAGRRDWGGGRARRHGRPRAGARARAHRPVRDAPQAVDLRAAARRRP